MKREVFSDPYTEASTTYDFRTRMLDAQPHKNTHTSPIKYKFGQTDREVFERVFESTLQAALSSDDIPSLSLQRI